MPEFSSPSKTRHGGIDLNKDFFVVVVVVVVDVVIVVVVVVVVYISFST